MYEFNMGHKLMYEVHIYPIIYIPPTDGALVVTPILSISNFNRVRERGFVRASAS